MFHTTSFSVNVDKQYSRPTSESNIKQKQVLYGGEKLKPGETFGGLKRLMWVIMNNSKVENQLMFVREGLHVKCNDGYRY